MPLTMPLAMTLALTLAMAMDLAKARVKKGREAFLKICLAISFIF